MLGTARYGTKGPDRYSHHRLGQILVAYTYDANARLRTITQAPLTPVTIDYDAANRRALHTLPKRAITILA